MQASIYTFQRFFMCLLNPGAKIVNPYRKNWNIFILSIQVILEPILILITPFMNSTFMTNSIFLTLGQKHEEKHFSITSILIPWRSVKFNSEPSDITRGFADGGKDVDKHKQKAIQMMELHTAEGDVDTWFRDIWKVCWNMTFTVLMLPGHKWHYPHSYRTVRKKEESFVFISGKKETFSKCLL